MKRDCFMALMLRILMPSMETTSTGVMPEATSVGSVVLVSEW